MHLNRHKYDMEWYVPKFVNSILMMIDRRLDRCVAVLLPSHELVWLKTIGMAMFQNGN